MRAAALVAAAVLAVPAPAPAGERVVRADGHVDIGPRLEAGRLEIGVRDGAADPPPWREPADVVLHVPEAAAVTVPDDPRFAFLGTAGDRVWTLAQVQQPGVVWPGWSTGDPSLAGALASDVTWRLTGVSGPGRFSLFLTGDFGEPQVLFDSAQPFPQEVPVPQNTHAHGNWAFGAPGAYGLELAMSARASDGTALKDGARLQFFVGDGDPAAAFGDPEPSPVPTPTRTPESTPESTPVAPPAATAGGAPAGAIAAASAAALAAAGLLALRRRRGGS